VNAKKYGRASPLSLITACWSCVLNRTLPNIKDCPACSRYADAGDHYQPLVQINGDRNLVKCFQRRACPRRTWSGNGDQGWPVAMTALTTSVPRGRTLFNWRDTPPAGDVATQLRINSDATVRQKLAQFHIEMQVLRLGEMRPAHRRLRGHQPGDETLLARSLAVNSISVSRIRHGVTGPYSQCAEVDPQVWWRILVTLGTDLTGTIRSLAALQKFSATSSANGYWGCRGTKNLPCSVETR